jgi:MFS family permease
MASSSSTTTTWKYEAIPEDAPDEHSENVLKPTTFAASSALVDGKGGDDVTVDSLSSKNIGIHLSYFAVGIVSRIIQAPLQYYLIHQLGMSSTTYSGNIALNKLPWTFKVCYGVVVDAVPLFGRRRKPWMTVGWGFVVVISFIFAAMGSPSVYPTVFLYFGITFFEVLADVATDSLAVDLSFYEPEQQRGGLQTTGYIFRSSGKIIGALIGTYLFNNHISTTTQHTHFPTFAKIGDMFMLQGIIIALSTFGFLYPLQEFAPHKRGFTDVGHAVRALLGDIWQVLQLRAVWRPMAFLFVYNVMQVPNPAWSNFIVVGLGFSSRDLGYLSLGSSLLSLAGYTFFRVYLFDTSWRLIYVSTSVVALVFTLLEVLLAMRINVALGVPDIWFAVGEDLILTFVGTSPLLAHPATYFVRPLTTDALSPALYLQKSCT